MSVKVFSTGEVLTASDTNTYLANSGLVYIKSQTIGSGVTTVTVSSAFNSDYDNYKILITGGVASSTGEMQMRLGSTTSNYYYSYVFTAWSATVNSDSSKTGAKFPYVGSATTNGLIADITVLSPNLAKPTRVYAPGTGDFTSYVGNMAGFLNNTTQYTAFDIFISNETPTMTGGTITVYGYRKA